MNAAAPAPASLLAVRLGAMGDIIHTLPAATALRNALPDARIGWVIEERWVDLLCARSFPKSGPRGPSRPLVDFVHPINTKAWRKSMLSRQTRRDISAALHKVRELKYDIAVDFQGAMKSAIIARCAGARYVIGQDHPREFPARLLYTRRVATNKTHVVEQYHSLAEAAAGKTLPIPEVELPHDPEAEAEIANKVAGLGTKEFVLITPGAGWGAKQWPPERYGAVAGALAGDGIIPLINCAPGEEKLAHAVQAASDNSAHLISCSVAELIALVRRSRLFIGGDTGPLHLAAALQIPVVAIFGPTDPARNGPYGTRSVVLRNPASPTSLSHTSAPDPGLLRITADEVLSAARQLLWSPHA